MTTHRSCEEEVDVTETNWGTCFYCAHCDLDLDVKDIVEVDR